MASYNAPGVYIEEIQTFPPSIAAVETAIPAFIGFTEKAEDDDGSSLANIPKRITSLLEFEQYFGVAEIHAFTVDVEQRQLTSNSQIIDTQVSFNGAIPAIPDFFLYYSMQMFFANGGGPCYICSVGDSDGSVAYSTALFTGAIDAIETFDEPTLLVFPEAVKGTDAEVATIIDHALASCAKLQDRFTIADIRDAIIGGTEDNGNVNTNFRTLVTNDLEQKKYGATYMPYLRTRLNFLTDDDNIEITTHNIIPIAADGSEGAPDPTAPPAIAVGTAISDTTVIEQDTTVYNAVKTYIREKGLVTLPPSGAVAGLYARVDENRGVWKSPANYSLSLVNAPTIKIDNALQGDLNIDATSGKSVNAIRTFTGKGTLVWGARTLAGNDNEWRYISVRRFFNFVEESVKKGTSTFVFEPNDKNTWIKVKTMISNFLVLQWRDGALTGEKPEHAFFVNVGLNETMSAQDILNGYMIIEIGMAVVRPAEFIVLRFFHKMQES